MLDIGRAETLSSRVTVSVVALGPGLGGVLNLTLDHDFAAVGLADADLAALARWTPDDWGRVTQQRLYVLLSYAHFGLRIQDTARSLLAPELDLPVELLTLRALPLGQPDAMVLARLAAVALHDRAQ